LGFVPDRCEGVAAAVAWEVDMPGHQTWRLVVLVFLQRIRAAVTGA
jgi:hypothetical protein